MKVIVAVLALALAATAEVYDESPAAPSVKDITFTLYQRKHGNTGVQMFLNDKDSIKKSGFDAALPVIVGTHGFMDDACSDSVQGFRKAFLAKADANFISIDWAAFAKNSKYEVAAKNVKTVGLHISKFLKFLRDETKFDVSKVHVVAHSMGAQVVSFISDEFPKEKVGRISAFDAAGPVFDKLPASERLDPADAIFVDVIHTSTKYPGIRDPVGAVDFYPNSGNNQPGCGADDYHCNHLMAYRYFLQTVKSGKNYDAKKCDSLKDAESGNCNGPKGAMGIGAAETKPGIYYLKVTAAPAFE